MTSLADQVITALRSGHDDLSAYVAKLEEKDLAGPSGASNWTVAQVLSHLGSGAEISLASLDRALTGDTSSLDGFNQKVWARWDAMAPREQRDGFVEANTRLVERYEGLDAATREDLRIDLGFLPEPVTVAVAARMRLSEFALHDWDARVGADPTATLAPTAVPLLLDGLVPLLSWISRPERLDGRVARLAVELTDPPSAHGLILGEPVAVTETPATPDGVLRAPTEAWLRLLSGRLTPPHTPATVELTGPISLADLRRVFPGY